MIRIFLKESRAEQLRREIDDAVNGTDYGHSSIKPGDDETANRFKGLEVDDEIRPTENSAVNLPQPKPRVDYHPNGQKHTEKFYVEGRLHREDGPAVIFWHENGQRQLECFYINGELHRLDGPAYNTWWDNGKKRDEQFFVDGKCHRTDGPARTTWYENGQKSLEEFCNNAKLHRINGPAQIFWNENGQKSSERFYVENKLHRLDGPATFSWTRDGQTRYERFFVNNQELTEKEWLRLNHDYLDLSEPATEYKFTKNRKQPSDPRYASLDLSDNQPPQKTDDKELEGRAKGLEVEPPKAPNAYKFTKNRKPEEEQRYKALELDEKLNRIRKEFKRLL